MTKGAQDFLGLPRCQWCNTVREPMVEGRFLVGLFSASMGVALVCTRCDGMPGWMIHVSRYIWAEMEQLERASWPRRVEGFVNPQANPPEQG